MRKQTKLKKLLTMILALVLVVGMLSPMSGVKAADPVVMTVDKIAESYWADGSWTIVLNLAESLPGIGDWPGTLQGVTYSINGEEPISVAIEPKSGSELVLVVGLEENIVGTTLTIACDGRLQDWVGNTLLESVIFAEPVVLIGTETGWELQQGSDADIQTVTINRLISAELSENAWAIHLKLAETLNGISAWTPFFGMTCTIDGAPVEHSLENADATSLYFMVASGQEVAGKTLTISGTAVISDESKGIQLAEPVTLIGTETGWELQQAQDGSTGTLSLVDSDVSKSTVIQLDTQKKAMLNTESKDLTPVSGRAGMLLNGVLFGGGSLKSLASATKNRLEWTIPGIEAMNIQVGDELKIFGEFTYDEDSTIWVTPTVIRCVQLNAEGTEAYWEIISSQEETVKTVEAVENLLSISDLDSSGVITQGQFGGDLIKEATVVGKSFKTYVTYEEVADTGADARIWLYYGATGKVLQNCVTARVDTDGAFWITLWSGTTGSIDNEGCQKKFTIEAGREYLLEIDISNPDSSNNGTVVVKFDGEVVIDQTVDISVFTNQMIFSANNAKWSAVYRDYQACKLDYTMSAAEEITAVDFGLEGTHTQATSGRLNRSIDGKKLALEVSDIIGASTECLELTYGNMLLKLGVDGKTVEVYTTCGKQKLGEYKAEEDASFRIEILTEYMDLDNDGINDDMRSLLRVNQVLVHLAEISEKHCETCGLTTEGGYWVCTNDRLYSETSELQFSENDKLLSISDLDASGVITIGQFAGTHTKQATVLGKSFKTYVTYENVDGTGANSRTTLYYGAPEAAFKNCITVRRDADGTVWITAWNSSGGAYAQKSLSVENGTSYLLEIDLSEPNPLDNTSSVSVRFGGTEMINCTVDATIFDDQLFFVANNAVWQTTYRNYKAIESYKIGSLFTQATAELVDGILTISGRGTVISTVLEGVVTDPTEVTDIVINNGITAIASGIFSGYTNLQTVTYANSVVSVADDAFVECPSDVAIISPTGAEFSGGLQNPIFAKVVANTYVPETGIVNPPIVITEVEDETAYSKLQKSAVAILDIGVDDGVLKIYAEDGTEICTLDEYYDSKYQYTVVPAFYLDRSDEVDPLCRYLSEHHILDALYITNDADLLKSAKSTYAAVRGVLKFDTLPTSVEGRGEHRRQINYSQAVVAVYPSVDLTADIVAEYNMRGISVWSYAEDKGTVYAGISDGVNGLIGNDPATIIDVYESITTPTLSGKPQAIAHRGANSTGQTVEDQMTIATMEAAVASGCTTLEIDILLSKDNQIIVLGGDTFTQMTAVLNEQGKDAPTGKIYEYTLEELNVYKKAAWPEAGSIPTLEEVFNKFSGTDVVLYLHINWLYPYNVVGEELATYNDAQKTALHTLVDQFEDRAGAGIADNVVVFLRNDYAYNYRGEHELSFSGGYFEGLNNTHWYYNEDALSDQYQYIAALHGDESLRDAQMMPFTYNLVGGTSDKNNLDKVTQDDSLSYRMASRGYLVMQTARYAESKEYQDDYFIKKMGGTAVMTNHSEYVSEYLYQIDVEDEIWAVGKSINLEKKIRSVAGNGVSVTCGFTYVNGTPISESNGSFALDTVGKAEVVYHADITLERTGEDLTYRVYSNPVTITSWNVGDTNGDGNVTALDLVRMKKESSKPSPNLAIYDLGGDDKVDVIDVSRMRELIVGKETL